MYGYNIPGNMYAAGALHHLLLLNNETWKSSEISTRASKLLDNIRSGIEKHGIVTTTDGTKVRVIVIERLQPA